MKERLLTGIETNPKIMFGKPVIKGIGVDGRDNFRKICLWRVRGRSISDIKSEKCRKGESKMPFDFFSHAFPFPFVYTRDADACLINLLRN